MDAVGLNGPIAFDRSTPDGTSRKLLDVSRIKEQGWAVQTGLEDGIAKACADFLGRDDTF